MTPLEQILLALLTVIISGFVSFFIVGRQLKADLKKHYETKFNEKKWEVYTKLLAIQELVPNYHGWWELNDKFPDKDTHDKYQKISQEMDKKLASFRNDIFLIGSREVVVNFAEWTRTLPVNDDTRESYFRTLVDLINSIRKDLGQSESKINFDDLDGKYFWSEKKVEKMRKYHAEHPEVFANDDF